MNSPAISIIIPVYNADKYLRRCIESVLSQSLTDFELILVNDGSIDTSPQICDEYASKDTRVQVIHKANGGVSSARNDGLDIAKGEYITFIDSDDWVENGYLFELYKQNEFDYVIGTFMNEPNGKVQTMREEQFIGDTLKDYVTIPYLSNGYPWGKLFNAKIIHNNHIRFKQIKVYEDLLFCLEYARNCSSIICISKANYHYYNPNDKSIPEKFPLTTEEVVWLYRNTQKDVDLISKRFKTNSITLLFNFYLHLNLSEFYKTGNDENFYRTYMTLNANATLEEYYNDLNASPIRIFIDKIFNINIIDCHRIMKMIKLVKSMDYSHYLTTIKYGSNYKYACAYCINSRAYYLAILVIILKKIKDNFLCKFRN